MRQAVVGCALLALGTLGACAAEERDAAVDVAVHVRVVTLDPVSNTPVIVLEEEAGQRRLPIWIGIAEARSIAQRLEEVELPRPNTHDLAKRLVEGLDGVVERVTVTELRDGTYYALIDLRTQGRTVRIDSRPSDAIALALRTAAPVFVREILFEKGNAPDGEEAEQGEEAPGRRTRAPAGTASATPVVGGGNPTGIGSGVGAPTWRAG